MTPTERADTRPRRKSGRPGHAAARPAGRVLAVVGLLLRNSRLVLALPVGAAAILLATKFFLADWGDLFPADVLDRAATRYDGTARRISAPAFAIVVVVAVPVVAAVGRTFRQAVRLGFARAEVLRGTVVHVLLVAVVAGASLTVLRVLERATTGFGVRMLLFDVPLFGPTLASTPLRVIGLVLVFVALGASAAAIRRRTGSVLVATAVLVVGFVVSGAAVYGLAHVLPVIPDWGIGRAALVLLAVPAAVTWWLLLRRAPVD